MQIGEIAESVRTGAISATEVLDGHLARLEERNGELNAVVILDVDAARSAAAGRPQGPLAGVPFTVKEAIVVEGLPGREASLLRPLEIGAAGRDRGRAPAGGGRDPGRQDEHLGALRPPRLVEPRLRRDAQPVRPHALGRRLERRRGRRGRGRHVGVRHRLRLRRVGAGAGELLRRRRDAARRGLRADRRAPAASSKPYFRERLSTIGPLARGGRGSRARALGAGRRARRLRLRAGARRRLPRRARPLRLGGVRRGRRARRRSARVRGRRRRPALPARGRGALLRGERGRDARDHRASSARSKRRRRSCSWIARRRRGSSAAPVDAAARCSPPSRPRRSAGSSDVPVLLAPAAAEPAFELGGLEGNVFELFHHCTLASALGLPAAVVPVAALGRGLPIGVQVIGRRGHESEVLGVARAIEIRAGTIAR